MWIFFFGVTIGWKSGDQASKPSPWQSLFPKVPSICELEEGRGAGMVVRGEIPPKQHEGSRRFPMSLLGECPNQLSSLVSPMQVSSRRWLIPGASNIIAICLPQLLGETGCGWNPLPSPNEWRIFLSPTCFFGKTQHDKQYNMTTLVSKQKHRT